jgi:hypothetical protein
MSTPSSTGLPALQTQTASAAAAASVGTDEQTFMNEVLSRSFKYPRQSPQHIGGLIYDTSGQGQLYNGLDGVLSDLCVARLASENKSERDTVCVGQKLAGAQVISRSLLPLGTTLINSGLSGTFAFAESLGAKVLLMLSRAGVAGLLSRDNPYMAAGKQFSTDALTAVTPKLIDKYQLFGDVVNQPIEV